MKKTYISPKMKLVKLQIGQSLMIAVSGSNYNSSNHDLLSRDANAWDDEDDE